MSEHYFVGIDVSKAHLDVSIRPDEEVSSFANSEAGIAELVERLDSLTPELIVLEAIERETGVQVKKGEHRRNVVTRGIDPRMLRNKRFRVGEALFEYRGPRSVCRYIERITEPGMTAALRGRGGFCARVVVGGVFNAGDIITLVENAQ